MERFLENIEYNFIYTPSTCIMVYKCIDLNVKMICINIDGSLGITTIQWDDLYLERYVHTWPIFYDPTKKVLIGVFFYFNVLGKILFNIVKNFD
jgi:hypothetical protein